MARIIGIPTPAGTPSIQEQFEREIIAESDRGAALLAASGLDEQLLAILRAFLIDSRACRELIGIENKGSAPVGTFSARIKLAFSLGLISEPEYNDCQLIRGIRNEFAHKFEMQFSFTQEAVAQRLQGFQLLSQATRKNCKGDPRRMFLQGLAALYSRWSTRHFYVEESKLQKWDWNDARIRLFPMKMDLDEPQSAVEAKPQSPPE